MQIQSKPFGSSLTPAFGASSTPAFGASSSAFGGSSVFGQKPAFREFGSTLAQSSPFGFQASQPVFGSSVFGSFTAIGAPSQPSFGASSTPASGATSSLAFGATSSPAFGAFSFGTSPACCQSTSAFSSSPFAVAPSAFDSQSSPFGPQATTPTFGNTNFGQQQAFGGRRGGSRVASYTPTTDADVAAEEQAGKLESISAMPVYKDKSHEELRWEDYHLGDKGVSVFLILVGQLVTSLVVLYHYVAC